MPTSKLSFAAIGVSIIVRLIGVGVGVGGGEIAPQRRLQASAIVEVCIPYTK